jgi:hypothetical protein
MATERKQKRSTARSSNGSNGRVSAPQVVRRAVEQMAQLTGRQIEGVLGLERQDEGWVVTLEVVELRRIPDSTDVLGSYAVAVDKRGELQEYRRTRRYYRSQVEEG